MLLLLNKRRLGIWWTTALRYSVTRLQPSTLPMMTTTTHNRNHHPGILMILSPAKTLDLTPLEEEEIVMVKNVEITQPDCHVEQTQHIAHCMKQRTPSELAKLLGLSTHLAQTAAGYWKAYDDDHDHDEEKYQSPLASPPNNPHAKPCIFTFSGAAYQGLDIHTCCDNNSAVLSYMQTSLRIIDPLYGLLRPLDLIQPYRLEMATKHVLLDDGGGKNLKLADYWKPVVTQRLSNDLHQFSASILLNLASDEYSAAVDPSRLPPTTKYIKVVFREPNGKVVAVHAKRARGLMVRYLSRMQATTAEQIHSFALEGYAFQPQDSDETTFVFQRQSPPATVASKRSTATTTRTKPAAKRTRKS